MYLCSSSQPLPGSGFIQFCRWSRRFRRNACASLAPPSSIVSCIMLRTYTNSPPAQVNPSGSIMEPRCAANRLPSCFIATTRNQDISRICVSSRIRSVRKNLSSVPPFALSLRNVSGRRTANRFLTSVYNTITFIKTEPESL